MRRRSRGISPALDQFAAAARHIEDLDSRREIDAAIPQAFRGDEPDVAVRGNRVMGVSVGRVGQDDGDGAELEAIGFVDHRASPGLGLDRDEEALGGEKGLIETSHQEVGGLATDQLLAQDQASRGELWRHGGALDGVIPTGCVFVGRTTVEVPEEKAQGRKAKCQCEEEHQCAPRIDARRKASSLMRKP